MNPSIEGLSRDAPEGLAPHLKTQIYLEERYRSEVRSQLASEAPKPNRLLSFLNTSLGIWFLSTLVVGGLGWAYTSVQQNFEKRRSVEQEQTRRARERAALIDKLDLEISFRLANLVAYLNEKHLQQAQSKRKNEPVEQLMSRRMSLILQVPPALSVQYNYPSLSLFHENRLKTLPNLLAELSLLVKSESVDEEGRAADLHDNAASSVAKESTAADSITRSLARLSDMTGFFEVRDLLRRQDNAQLVASAFQSDIFLPRWRQSEFFYTDCNARVPFC